jgi:anion-transporting  ArsA/GET3 family ATPase
MSKVRNLVGRGVRLIEPTGLADGSSERLVEVLPQAYDAKLPDLPPSKLPAEIMDFGEVYREARLESPAHGYGIDKIESMLNHPRLVALRPEQRAAAVLAALEAAGVEFTDVLRDAVVRDQAIERFALAKESEMQAERLRAEEAVIRARQELDAFVTEKRAEVERLRREIKEAEARFAEIQERRRIEERRILEVSDHLSDAPPVARDEALPSGAPALLRPQGA